MFEFGLSICRRPAGASRNKKNVAGAPLEVKGKNTYQREPRYELKNRICIGGSSAGG